MVPSIGSMQMKENQLTCKLGPLHDLVFVLFVRFFLLRELLLTFTCINYYTV